MNYAAPWWLPGGNLQTIWAALRSQRFLGEQPLFRRERWTTPDSDFVDVDWSVQTGSAGSPLLEAKSVGEKPLLVVFHGLEGSSGSHYAEATPRR